jgi:hypothetical protein
MRRSALLDPQEQSGCGDAGGRQRHVTRPDKISSSNLLDSLAADYNYLIMTAQIVDGKAPYFWEYPNFDSAASLTRRCLTCSTLILTRPGPT